MENVKLFNKYNEGKHWESHPTVYAEEFLSFLKEKNFTGNIVDLGCGNGRDVDVFNRKGFKVLGIDKSEENIKNAKRNFPNYKFEIQDIEKLKIKNNSVGAVFMINVIHYINKVKSIEEIYRILEDGGYFYIHFNLSITDSEGNIDYKDSEEEILKLISSFKIIERERIERVDKIPKMHKHIILKLILRKWQKRN